MIIDVSAGHPQILDVLRKLRGKKNCLLVSIDGLPERHRVTGLRTRYGEGFFKANDGIWYSLTGACWTFYVENLSVSVKGKK